MIIDSSAVVAILNGEPDASAFAKAIQDASERRMSAATYVELAAVVERTRDPVASRLLDDFPARMRIEIMPSLRTRRGQPAAPTGTTARAAATEPD